MTDLAARPCTAFIGHRLLRAGPLADIAVAIARMTKPDDAILVFDDSSGQVVDLDLRGDDSEIRARLTAPPAAPAGRYRPKPHAADATAAQEEDRDPRGRGRPKLGVVAREVTLLPRHWDWLTAQSGGASAALRRLVDEARRKPPSRPNRAAQDAAYRFMQAIAGDLPGYEEATRALFADDRAGLEERIANWPADIRTYALRLASGSALPSAPS